MTKLKIYFPNLNGLRFLAAFLVIIHHIEQIKFIKNVPNYWQTVPFINIIGRLGVVLFFVLSGFLITYLLLTEEKTFKFISLKKFYLRRILRIWPLYFLIIFLAFVVFPNLTIFTWPNYEKWIVYDNLGLKLILYIIFLPNLVLSLLGIIPYASHTWSIGTEEQYYFIWPVILRVFKRHRLLLMVFIICFYLIVRFFLTTHYSNFLTFKNIVIAFWSTFTIDCMAIGGIYAVLLFQKNKVLKYLFNKSLFYFTICFVIALMATGIYIPYFHDEVYSLLFGIIILNFGASKKAKISLESKPLRYLGKISYGLYMYHPIGIVISLCICIQINFITNWIIYPLSFILTIVLADLSYNHYETFFLKFKDKFSKILTVNDYKL